MERFRTCDECSRHVRVSEMKCPFCGHALEAAKLAPVPRGPAQLSRAQRIALIAAVAGSIAACGDDSASNKPSAQGIAGAAAGASATGGTTAAGAAAAGTSAAGAGAAGALSTAIYGAPTIPHHGISPPPPPDRDGEGGAGSSGNGSAGQGGAAGAAHGGSAGEGGAAGSAGEHAAAGSGGAAGSAGKPAAAGSGGVMVHPLYGASPAYGLPPAPPEK
jgi:hypothetical protein